MSDNLRLIVFWVLGAAAVWGLFKAARTGEASSRGFTFRYDSSPFWFSVLMATRVLILVFCVMEVLYVFRLSPDPVALISGYFAAAR